MSIFHGSLRLTNDEIWNSIYVACMSYVGVNDEAFN